LISPIISPISHPSSLICKNNAFYIIVS
jgi:hypothetical protein